MDYREWGFYGRVYLMHGSSKGEARKRSRHQNNSHRVVRNMEEMNVGTEGNTQTRPN